MYSQIFFQLTGWIANLAIIQTLGTQWIVNGNLLLCKFKVVPPLQWKKIGLIIVYFSNAFKRGS